MSAFPGPSDLTWAHPPRRLAERHQFTQPGELALGNIERQVREVSLRKHVGLRAALHKLYRFERLHRPDVGNDPASARRHEPIVCDLHIDIGAHPAQQRQIGGRHELERRRRRIVGAAADGDARRPARLQERQQNCLKHQHGAACRADGKLIGPRPQRARIEFKGRGADAGIVGMLAATERCRRLQRGQVLAQQAGFLPPGPDVFHAERLAGQRGQAERRTQNLPAALTFRSINQNH